MAYKYEDGKQKDNIETEVPEKMTSLNKCSVCKGTGEIEKEVNGERIKSPCFCRNLKKLFRK